MPIGLIGYGLVQPTRPKDVPVDTYFGHTVTIVSGANSGGKSHLASTIIQARIAASLGDIVFAKRFAYDPDGKIIVPYLPGEVKSRGGGFNATIDELFKGLPEDIYRGSIIIQDESGGVTSEEVERRMVENLLSDLSARGLGAYFF